MIALPWWRRWRTTLTGAFLLLALALVGFQVSDVTEAYRHAEDRARAEQAETAWHLGGAAQLLVARYAGLADSAATAIFGTPLAPRERRALLARIRAAHPEIEGLAVLDAAGRLIDAEPAPGHGPDIMSRREVQAILGGAALAAGDLVPRPRSERWVVSILAAARASSGALQGIVSVVVPDTTFEQALALHLSGKASALLLDRKGQAIVRAGSGFGRDYAGVPLFTRTIADRTARAELFRSPVDGLARFGTAVPVWGTEWVAAAVQPLEAVRGPGRAALRQASTRAALVLSVALGLALLLAARLSRPVDALAEAVDAIGRGDLSRRVPVGGRRDELAVLAERVNAMAERLEAAREALASTNARLRESEGRFRTMADTAPVLIRTARADGAFDFVSRRWTEFTDGGLATGFGSGWTAHLHPEDRARWLAAYGRAFAARQPFRLDYRLRRHDGQYRWLLETAVPRFEPDGAFAGYIGSCVDITEIKEAEAQRDALLERERASRQQLERAHRRAAFLVEAGTRLAGTLDLEAALADVTRLVVPELADRCIASLVEADGSVRHVAEAGADVAGPISDVIRTGRSACVAEAPPARPLMVVPLVARGRILGAMTFVGWPGRRFEPEELALAEDLARRAGLGMDNARLYGEAQRAVAEAQAAVRSREAFLARASHELRTPLTSALGAIRMLAKATRGTLSESSVFLTETASRNLGAMAKLVNDLLDVSKLAAGEEPLARRTVELAAAVADSMGAVSLQASEKGVALTAVIEDGFTVSADPLKLEQLLVNLLANAVKFTPAGGAVRVEASREEDHVVLRVRDTGEGIPEDLLEAIFEPFVQGRAGDTRRPRGTGLGLAICRQIVRQHGGAIWAESEGIGRGSTFAVRLPAAPRPGGPAA